MKKTHIALGSGMLAVAAVGATTGPAQAKNNPPKPQITHHGSITSPFTDITYDCNFVVNNGHPLGVYEWDPTPTVYPDTEFLNFAPCNAYTKV